MKRITTIGLVAISLLFLSDRMFFKSKAEETASVQRTKQSSDRELLQQRYLAATEVLNAEKQSFQSSIKRICRAARRAHKAEIALYSDQEELIALHTRHLNLLRDMEKRAEANRSAGGLSHADLALIRYWRLTAEIKLLTLLRKHAFNQEASRTSPKKRMTRIEEALGRIRVLYLWA